MRQTGKRLAGTAAVVFILSAVWGGVDARTVGVVAVMVGLFVGVPLWVLGAMIQRRRKAPGTSKIKEALGLLSVEVDQRVDDLGDTDDRRRSGRIPPPPGPG